MKDQYIVYGRINKRGKKYFIVFDNIAQRGIIGKGNYSNEAAAMAEAERLNAIARARIPAPLERGEHGNKVVLFKSEFIRMKQAVEENEDLRIAAVEGKQVKNELEDLQLRLPGLLAKVANDAAANAAKAVSEQYNQALKNVAGERDKAINERDIEKAGRENAEKERDKAKSEIVKVEKERDQVLNKMDKVEKERDRARGERDSAEKERDQARCERDKAEEEKAALLKENRALKDFIKNNL